MADLMLIHAESSDQCHLDDLPCHLNPVQCMDLATILSLTPAPKRAAVMLAYVGWTHEQWAAAAGFQLSTLTRWLNRAHRLPYGAALRLAAVVDVDPQILFADWA